jgi:hypothetical protein
MPSIPKAATPAAAVVFACVVFAGGCSSDREYYRVRDSNTGRVFYTKDLEERANGAVTLTDAASGQRVTLQNSEVKQISKQTYYNSRQASGKNPEEVAAATAAAAAGTEQPGPAPASIAPASVPASQPAAPER